jgi:hypothetical protein
MENLKKSLRAVLFLGAGRGTTVEDSHSPSAATRKPGAWPDEMKRPAANEGARRRPAPDAIRRVRYGVQGPPIAGSAGSQERGASRCKGALPPAQRRRGWPRQNEPHGSWLGSRVHRRARTGRTFRSCFNNVERIAIGSRRIGKCLGRNWGCSQRRSQRLALADGGGPPPGSTLVCPRSFSLLFWVSGRRSVSLGTGGDQLDGRWRPILRRRSRVRRRRRRSRTGNCTNPVALWRGGLHR